jgi:hypothetical protein
LDYLIIAILYKNPATKFTGFFLFKWFNELHIGTTTEVDYAFSLSHLYAIGNSIILDQLCIRKSQTNLKCRQAKLQVATIN